MTGDLVRQDAEGFLYFCGRLKRFLKVGGEMVSLPALEEPLAARWPPTESGPHVAVEGIETPGGRCIVLFAIHSISLREANAVLSEFGLPGCHAPGRSPASRNHSRSGYGQDRL